LTIDQTGVAALAWTAVGDAAWLSVSPASGTSPIVAWVSVATAGLAVGSYTGTITLSSSGAANRRLTVPVTLALGPNLSLTGRWVGVSDSVNLAVTLEESSLGSLTGSGSLYPPLRTVIVTGAYLSPSVALALTGPGSTLTTFSGSLAGANAIVGTLNGPGSFSSPIALFRQ
jgi:hypothetical protein